MFGVQGPDAPVSAVADVAGVGIATLYRRFPSKEVLLQHLCEASLAQQAEAARDALAVKPAWDALEGFVRRCVAFRAGAFSTFAGTVLATDTMRAAAEESHALLEKLVRRAQVARELRADVATVDIHRLIELFSRRLPDDEESYLRLLVIAIDGLRAPAVRPLPLPDPSWNSYASRWT